MGSPRLGRLARREPSQPRDGGGSDLLYDYFGSWSEASSDCQVRLADAVAAMEEFAQSGTPVTERVIFQPD